MTDAINELILIACLGVLFFPPFRPMDQLRRQNEPGSLEQRPLVIVVKLLDIPLEVVLKR